MVLKCDDLGSVIVLTVDQKRLDSHSAASFREAALECIRSDCHIYILDMRDVTFVDSTGIGAVVGLLKQLGRERRLEICGMNPMVRKVFRMTRLDKVFAIRTDRAACISFYETAIRAVSSAKLATN